MENVNTVFSGLGFSCVGVRELRTGSYVFELASVGRMTLHVQVLNGKGYVVFSKIPTHVDVKEDLNKVHEALQVNTRVESFQEDNAYVYKYDTGEYVVDQVLPIYVQEVLKELLEYVENDLLGLLKEVKTTVK